MKDTLIIGTAAEGAVRFVAASTRNLVNEAVKIHQCRPTAAAALGRMLTAGVMMGSMLKNEQDVLTLQIKGGGPAGLVIVTAYADGRVKGYIGNPAVDLPQNDKGKLDVGGAIGTDGMLTVIRDIGLREPYVGQIPIVTGEIGDDLTNYFAKSEQTPSAVGVGVLVASDLSIKASGGFIIQMMPGANELAADLLSYRLEEMKSITELLDSGKDIETIMKDLFEDMSVKIMEYREPFYKCDCSREKVEKALISIGKADLTEIYEEGKSEEIQCHFCNTSYHFSNDEIGDLLYKI
ncbi:Hsp33 family molecular chaperone HslO [Clostridium thermarum]|uniref:Hsp33 family molecular chaperone HslO n=1 Tax=Clostridium thermarum TaxID=1716543 RepID=UPI0013D7E97C|nr:Hsp33 family molecular chaperone HslO [Clostridium thermarum]